MTRPIQSRHQHSLTACRQSSPFTSAARNGLVPSGRQSATGSCGGRGSGGESAVSTALMSAAIQQYLLSAHKIKLPRATQPVPAPSQSSQSQTLTLAQSLGLEPKPAPKLSESEWQSVESLSMIRGIHSDGCPICCEPFKLGEQTLTSCCHAFHSQCLLSFEQFANSRPVCPCCRAQSYEKRRVEYGKHHWRVQCVTRLQSVWRGYRARKLYSILNRTHSHIHTNTANDRQATILARMNATMTSILNVESVNDSEIDSLCDEFDLSITLARSALQAIGDRTANSDESSGNDSYWSLIRQQAITRGDDDCPICMTSLTSRTCALLSCSHVIHDQCLLTFERFHAASEPVVSVEHSGTSIISAPSPCSCPLCRAQYQKVLFVEVK